MLAEANAAHREIADRTQEAREIGSPLALIEALQGVEAEFGERGAAASSMLYTEMATVSAELGNVQEALRYADRIHGREAGVPAGTLGGWTSHDAVELVARRAEDETIVLVNEAHHVPQHRAFTILLLGALRERGFTHFAAEALFSEPGGFNGRDDGLQERGHPLATTGTYLSEPVYADLIRTALSLGFVVVSYESSSVDRELGQARNLVERVLEQDPDARLVVHAGYAHVHESGTLAGVTPMGARLRELTGIDPFTIDQTTMYERGSEEYESPLYRQVADGLTVPTLYTRGDEIYSAHPGRVDATLFHPRTVIVDGRPDWLRLEGRRQEVQIPPAVVQESEVLLVEATRAEEQGKGALPLDRLVLVPGEEVPCLLLEPGEYVVVSQRADGTEAGRAMLRVEN